MKKKVIIFTSTGGGGHTSATAALTSHLEPEFKVKPAHIFSEVLGTIDPGKILSFNHGSGEGLYNFFLRNKWNRWASWLYKVGNWYFTLTHKINIKLITEYLKREKPDVIISVAPLITNRDIAQVAKSLSIPFIIVPTDLDATTFTPGIDTTQSKNIACAIAFEDDALFAKLQSFAKSNIATTGFPLRASFFTQKNHAAIKKEFQVQKDRPVILLLMGAVGVNEIVPFTKALSHIETPAHIIICIGRNEALRAKLESLQIPSHITYTIVGFTDKIADLMSIADLLITKSGTVTFCEGLYMNVPILLDATTVVPMWEQFNHSFLVQHGFGKLIKHRSDLAHMVDDLLSHPQELATMKKNLVNFPKKQGCEEIKKLVQSAVVKS